MNKESPKNSLVQRVQQWLPPLKPRIIYISIRVLRVLLHRSVTLYLAWRADFKCQVYLPGAARAQCDRPELRMRAARDGSPCAEGKVGEGRRGSARVGEGRCGASVEWLMADG
jgi:hypothetical protein